MTYRYGAWMYPELFDKPPQKVCALCDSSFASKKTQPQPPKQQAKQEKKPA